jgi:hypothetical protein
MINLHLFQPIWNWKGKRYMFIVTLFEWRLVYNFEVRYLRCVGSTTMNFCVLHIQSNTTIFHSVVE